MEAREIFDKLEHVGIYVVDRQTMVTYYENPTARKYSVKNRIGKPCYSIHGNNSMCRSCPVRNKDHISLVNRVDLNMVFVVRSEEIDWEGHPAYLISVAKEESLPFRTENEKSMNRMSRALQKSVNVYTEINMETMRYRQINLQGSERYDVPGYGDYAPAFEHMCRDEIHPDDAVQVRRALAPDVLKRIAANSDGADEAVVRYRLKNTAFARTMESRAIFMRDELPHYVVCIARDVTEETLLQEHAHTMERTLNNVSCGVAIYNVSADGQIWVAYVNEGLAQMAECSIDVLRDAAQKDAFVIIDPSYRAAVKAVFQRLTSGENRGSITFKAVTFAGNTLWSTLKLVSSAREENSTCIYGTFFDVTAETETQRKFQEKYEIEKRRSQGDRSVLAYAVFNLRTHSTIEMERRKPFQSMKEIMSMDAFCKDIAPSIVSAEKRSQFERIFNLEALLREHEKGVDKQSLEYQRMLPDGKVIWVKSSFHLIEDSSRADILLFYYCNDINMSKSLELMTSYMVNEDYDMLGCVNLADNSAIMLYGNSSSRRPSGTRGLRCQESYSEALSWFMGNSVVPEERKFFYEQACASKVKSVLSRQNNYEFTLHVRETDGSVRTKKIRYTRYDMESGICFFSQTDITETLAQEKKKQDELQKALLAAKQANEAKTTFLSRMSHDMRTPMNGVLGLASLMRDEASFEDIYRDLDQLEISGRYLLQLINDTLDMSKIESGKMELRLKMVDSEAILGNVLANAACLAKEKGVCLKVQTPGFGHGRWVMADAPRLEQVIMNVLSNAIKFTSAGGTVEVIVETLSATDSEVVDRYVIRDTGIGMSEEFLPHIFEPFAQEGRVNTNPESGSGLGMSIVKQMVELMGGDISIESRVGEGTEVTLTIHYSLCQKKVAEAAKTSVDISVLNGKRTLLCEDHPLNAQIATRLLAKQGVLVEWAENGELGVERFSKSKPGYYDMILMDIRMPVMNGLDAARAIRAMERPDAKTTPIIAMTANAFEDDVQNCFSAGMNGHIAKPIDPPVMFQTIAKALA